MRKETRMYGDRLRFGTMGASNAAVIPRPASTGDSHAASTSKAVPPVCKKIYKDEQPPCVEGYTDGFEAGRKCGPPRMTGRYSDAEAYDVGYNAGYDSGRRNCPS
ncbi:hypothetical protein ACIBQ6_03335 [Nonomuraea sp. NPDC049655]|uniref:hypothetical protein n=1 Tax=Nonomuraea sp. NPDC049655 TaxID=3364355 RepID=UPI0037A4B1C7